MNTRQLFVIVPLAALLGISAALALYVVADRSGSSKLPAFRVALAKQGEAQGGAGNSPASSAALGRANALREAHRKRVAARRERRLRARAQRALVVPAPASRPAPSAQSTPTTVTTPVQIPVQRQAPAPVSRPAPSPAPRRSSGGGSFDDSG